VAEALSQIADRLEEATDFQAEVNLVVKDIIKKHKHIIFNGNNYSQEWVEEAAKRGLPNLKTTVDAIPSLIDEKNIKVFEKHGVLSATEIHSRYEIQLDSYIKTIRIEALTMVDMARKQILPASLRYVREVADTVASLNAIGADSSSTKSDLDKLVALTTSLRSNAEKLNSEVEKLDTESGDGLVNAKNCRDVIIPIMNDLRIDSDSLETMVDAKVWPIPTYGELLFGLL
jgi:glutamine synthetase